MTTGPPTRSWPREAHVSRGLALDSGGGSELPLMLFGPTFSEDSKGVRGQTGIIRGQGSRSKASADLYSRSVSHLLTLVPSGPDGRLSRLSGRREIRASEGDVRLGWRGRFGEQGCPAPVPTNRHGLCDPCEDTGPTHVTPDESRIVKGGNRQPAGGGGRHWAARRGRWAPLSEGRRPTCQAWGVPPPPQPPRLMGLLPGRRRGDSEGKKWRTWFLTRLHNELLPA